MGQLDLHLAQSIATERHTQVVRDADHRRLARGRSTVEDRPGRLARLRSWPDEVGEWLGRYAHQPALH